jgi:hypothetical protein
MSNIINFPFEEKEGKYFAPIVSEQSTYKVVNGAIVVDSTELMAGIKGVFAKVRLTLSANNAETKKELFALNSEAVNSSN